MHGITFEMKRAHWAGYRFAFDELRSHVTEENAEVLGRMTPARFDIMYVLYRSARAGTPRLRQSVLWKELGVHRSTLSKAVSAMVEIGYVVREHFEGRKQHPFVSLTAIGRRAIGLALGIAFGKHALRDEIKVFFHARAVEYGDTRRFDGYRMKCFLSELAIAGRDFCRHFGRTAAVVFPIEPFTEL